MFAATLSGGGRIRPAAAVVTVGTFDYGGGAVAYGFSSFEGSISPTVWNLYPIIELEWTSAYSVFPSNLTFAVTGSAPDAYWTSVTIGSIQYNRADASYTDSGSFTSWQWGDVANPFGTTVGATKTVTWI